MAAAMRFSRVAWILLLWACLPAARAAEQSESVAPRYLPEHEILVATQEGRWGEVLTLCDRLEVLLGNRPENPDQSQPYGLRSSRQLIAWARGLATWELSSDAPPELVDLPVVARHPLIERLSKKSYNLIQEFDAALAQGEFSHACRLVTEFADPQDWGLLRDPRDPQLVVNLPMEIELAVFRHPELCTAMDRHFGSLGLLRVRRAIGRDDAAAVESAAWRFYGSRAAAEAQQWLGDRWLSLGQAVEATDHYSIGLVGASAEQREDLLGRSRLAAALLGFDVGKSVTRPVRLGGFSLPPERFEEVVSRLVSARGKGATLAVGAGRSGNWYRATCPPPAAYTARLGARLHLRSHTMPAGVDWAARQVAAARVGGKLLLVSVGQLVCLDLESGKLAWRRNWAGWHRNRWSLVEPTQPVVDGDRVYLRYVSPEGYQLVSVDMATGAPFWGSDPQLAIASDPLLIGGDLIVFSVDRLAGDLLGLSLVRFDADTGHLLDQVRIAEFHNHRQGALPCRMTAVGNRIVATAGGAVFCCDFTGRIQWIRRQLYMPPVEDFAEAALWHPQIHRPPLVLRGRVLATQPGVWAVEGLDLRTGRLLWRSTPPGLQSLAGHYRGRVIVETVYGLAALDPTEGKTLWTHPIDLRLAAVACGPPGGVVYARLDEPQWTSGPAVRQAALVWLNPATGKPMYRLPLNLPDLGEADPLLGPLIVTRDRRWILAAPANRPTNRNIYELTE